MGLQSTLPHKSTHSTSGSDPLTPAQIGAATAAQGAKADTASQPGHTHTISNIIDLVGVTNFQPSPEYLSDEVSGITVTSSIGANDSLQKIADYWASGDWAVTKNGPTGTWLLEFIGDGSPASVASTNATQFPWQATWPSGTIVVKTPVARILGTSLASMASCNCSKTEGSPAAMACWMAGEFMSGANIIGILPPLNRISETWL